MGHFIQKVAQFSERNDYNNNGPARLYSLHCFRKFKKATLYAFNLFVSFILVCKLDCILISSLIELFNFLLSITRRLKNLPRDCKYISSNMLQSQPMLQIFLPKLASIDWSGLSFHLEVVRYNPDPQFLRHYRSFT